jgi:predicted TPR repeat methyltransferase
LNASRAELAAKRASFPVHRIPVERFSSSQKYDVITFINVLSHIPWFDPVFRSVRALLNDGGRFVMKTGELEPDVRKDDIYDWAIPSHVHFLGSRQPDTSPGNTVSVLSVT